MMRSALDRRSFLKIAACAAGARTAWAGTRPAAQSDAWRLVAATDHARILKAARNYVEEAPLTIPPLAAEDSAGGLHDFYSQADYFWPNPKDPSGPYVNRDGQSNPANFDDHRRVMVRLSIQVPALTAAWLLTHERRFSNRAVDHLRAWFVTPATCMNPNLQFAQAVTGASTGRSYGIIDSLHLVEVARAAHFLVSEMSVADGQTLIRWFSSYLDWLNTSGPGKTERDAKNNHSMCWALQAAEYARLAGNDDARRDL